MNKLLFSVVLASLVLPGSVLGQGASRKVYKPGETGNPPSERVEPSQYNRTNTVINTEYRRTPGGGHLDTTPIALTVGPFGMPYGRNWAICGFRLNLGFPACTHPYESVYGVDVGLSGETYGEAGGFLANVINNKSCDMYGFAVAGLWNRADGKGSVALQLAALFNSAERISGVQIGIANHAHELHGLQLGIYNTAVCGSGVQIGLWNDKGNGTGLPIFSIIY